MSDRFSLPRRDFVKLTLVGSASAAAAGCHTQGRELAPLLIPEETIVPGTAYWSRGLCRQCGAGCGVLVKRMQAIVPLERDGQAFRQARLVAKKLEGNPEHPLNQGGLCARGQAGLEATYHPRRLAAPGERTRPGAPLQRLSWSAAGDRLRRQLQAARPGEVAWLGRPLRATEAELTGAWLTRLQARWWEYEALPAPRAAADALRLERLPQADCLLSFGNFLEAWPGQAGAIRAYSRFRRRPGSVFLQAEPRLSLTGTNADQWIALRPGAEGVFALALAAQWIALRGGESSVPAWLRPYTPQRAGRICGVPASQLRAAARRLAAARQPLVLGGPGAYAHEHAAFQAAAIGFLASLAEGEASPAAALPAASSPAAAQPHKSGAPATPSAFSMPAGQPAPRVLIVHEANPVFSAPPGWKLEAWLASIPYVAVLGTMPDETAQMAHLVLPLSTTLESWADDERVTAAGFVASLNPPAMQPLHDTRSLIEIVTELSPPAVPAAPAASAKTAPAATASASSAAPAIAAVAAAAPAGAAELAIRRHWHAIQQRYAPRQPFADFWPAALERGGFWTAPAPANTPNAAAAAPSSAARRLQLPAQPSALTAPTAPASSEYPLYLDLYESPLMGDGTGSWLTWLQELPDPTTSAMWCNWVEVHPQLAAKLGLRQGDGAWVESAAGRIELPVFLYPGLRPDTVAIPAGQGHSAGDAPTNRGANPFRLLADLRDPATGALAWKANRVRLSASGRRLPLPLFGHSLHQEILHR